MTATAIHLRPAVTAVPRYRPGASGAALVKLSSNENPFPPLPGVMEAAVEASGALNRYPDHGATALVEALAARYGVPSGHVAVGTGSVALLHQIVMCTSGPGDEVVHAWRSFEAYPIAVGLAGATAVPVPLTVSEHHDLERMAAAVTARTRLIMLCSPNNPTGVTIGRAELAAFLDGVRPDVLVVLDEAYAEFVRDPDAADGLRAYREHPNVCVLRTFSKAYGLAGLRVGYAIAPEPVADALRASAVPFGVTAMAQEAARASLAPGLRAVLAERVDALVAERHRVAAALREAGRNPVEGEANFIWLRLGAGAESFAECCARHGVLVRAYPGDGVRVSVGLPTENDRFLAVACGA